MKMQIAQNTFMCTTLKLYNTNKTKTLHNYIKKILSKMKLDKSYKYHISNTKKLWNKTHDYVNIWPLNNPLQFKLTLEPLQGTVSFMKNYSILIG